MNTRRRSIPSSSDEWMQLAVRYLARWDRTVAQVERYLKDQGAPSAQAHETACRLLDLRYLNDRAYADRWVASRVARQPMGRARLKTELQGKGIAEAIAEHAVSQALRDVSEETLARWALERRQKTRRLTPMQIQRFLQQRGFEADTIGRMIRSAVNSDGTIWGYEI